MDLKQLVIYGAQTVAVSIYQAIKLLYRDYKVVAFLVEKKEGNPVSIEGIPVVILEQFNWKEIPVIIAVPEYYHNQIVKQLEERNINNYIVINSKSESKLMKKYYRRLKNYALLDDYQKGEKKANLSVYGVRNYKDKLIHSPLSQVNWLYPIQAGASLTNIKIADIRDNIGENISCKNYNYCELTAMYWIGKHGNNDYLGLYHYRRILEVTDEDLMKLDCNHIDAILPLPTIQYPNIQEHHKRYIKDSDWDAMLQALEECSPSYAAQMPEIFKGQYFYNYNILIAKKEIFQEYCDWLFPILKRTEELSVPKGWERKDRYIGYLGENLTTLYFMYNRQNYKIVHAGRILLT